MLQRRVALIVESGDHTKHEKSAEDDMREEMEMLNKDLEEALAELYANIASSCPSRTWTCLLGQNCMQIFTHRGRTFFLNHSCTMGGMEEQAIII